MDVRIVDRRNALSATKICNTVPLPSIIPSSPISTTRQSITRVEQHSPNRTISDGHDLSLSSSNPIFSPFPQKMGKKRPGNGVKKGPKPTTSDNAKAGAESDMYGWRKTVKLENERFERYYKDQKICRDDSDWKIFLEYCRMGLPTGVRVNGTLGEHGRKDVCIEWASMVVVQKLLWANWASRELWERMQECRIPLVESCRIAHTVAPSSVRTIFDERDDSWNVKCFLNNSQSSFPRPNRPEAVQLAALHRDRRRPRLDPCRRRKILRGVHSRRHDAQHRRGHRRVPQIAGEICRRGGDLQQQVPFWRV